MTAPPAMPSRRLLLAGALAAPALLTVRSGRAQDAEGGDEVYQLEYPSFASLYPKQLYGYMLPTAAQKERAREITDATPKGILPIDVAESFVSRFAASEPDTISQWPVPSAWNPLVVTFFDAVGDVPPGQATDMIAWCAAFANWCIERCGLSGSRSASSQSFLASQFRRVDVPSRGDLAVFTCFDPATGSSLRLGHVAFFAGPAGPDRIRVVGGNQGGNNRSSSISDTILRTDNRPVKRRVGPDYVPAVQRLSAYVSLS